MGFLYVNQTEPNSLTDIIVSKPLSKLGEVSINPRDCTTAQALAHDTNLYQSSGDR